MDFDDIIAQASEEAEKQGKNSTKGIIFYEEDGNWVFQNGSWKAEIDGTTGNVAISDGAEANYDDLALLFQRAMEEYRNFTISTMVGIFSGQISEALQQSGAFDVKP